MTRKRKENPWSVDYKQGDESGRTYDRVPLPDKALTETELRRHYVARCTERFSGRGSAPCVRMFIRNVGAIEVDGRVFRAGIKGQSDIYGYVLRQPFAIPFEVECKNIRTPESAAQTTWAAFCKQWNIPRLTIRAIRGESPEEILDRWVSETESFFIGISNTWAAALADRSPVGASISPPSKSGS